MKDLTVAICMYNAEKYIEETLDCIVKQTVQDFDLMIVNDCSMDNSPELVRSFFRSHPRQYELVDFSVNQGLCAGRRYVEENAKTRYILFVDADDCPYPTLVEKLYNKITSDEDLMAVGCFQEYMDSEGRKMKGGIFLGETTKEGFWKKAEAGKRIFMQPTAIYDRLLALKVGGHCIDGFPEGKPRYRDLCEDLDLWTRMSDLYVEKKAIVVIPEVLCRYRKHEQAMSSNSLGMMLRMKQIKDNVRRRRKGQDDLSFVQFLEQMDKEEYAELEKEAKAVDDLKHSYYSFKKGHVLQGCQSLFQSIANSPRYIVDKIKHNFLRMK